MKNVALLLAAAAALIAVLDVTAEAGWQVPVDTQSVEIRQNADGTGRFAGVPSAVAASANRIEFIECFFVHGSVPSMFCTARDADRTIGGCSTTDRALIEGARQVKPDNRLIVGWDSTGRCTAVLTYAGSQWGAR